MSKFWPKPCYEFGIKQAIEAGYLCDYVIYSTVNKFKIKPSKSKREYTEREVLAIIEKGKAHNQVKEIFEMTKDRNKIAIICASIEHAEKIKKIIEETEPCAIIHSKLKDAKKDLSEWQKNDVRFSVLVIMLSEGFDMPSIDAVVFLRPTRSPRLMIQASGRGLRLFPGKENCLLIDFGDVFLTCGTPRDPILQFEYKPDSSSSVVMRECSECLFVWGSIDSICPACGHDNKVIKDVEKSLAESLLDDDLYTVMLDKTNYIKSAKTVRGQRYCEYEINDDHFFFFGGNYWKAIKRPDMMVTYRLRDGKINVVKIDVL